MAGGGSSDGRSPRIDLVPIIDAMTCVIFFLLLSSTFVEFTKITMPQAVSSVASASVAAEPALSPKLVGVIKGSHIHMVLSWNGKEPDHITKSVLRDPTNKRSEVLETTTQNMLAEFKSRFPQEQVMLLGFSPKVTYQEVISAMDGARKEMNDLVMVSWTESQMAENMIGETKGN